MITQEKTVFISYRRSISKYAAKMVFDFLRSKGFDVFYDINSINSGDFEDAILANITARTHFVVLLSPESLRRCVNEDGTPNLEDWLRREIEFAIENERNVVPVLMDDFNFNTMSTYMTGELTKLSRYNACPIYYEYMDEGLNRLAERFLKPPTFPVKINPLTTKQKEISENKVQQAYNVPAPIKEELITEKQIGQGLKIESTSSANNLYDVFLSYSQKDIEWMQRIRFSLENAGINVWANDNSHPATNNQAIDISKVMVPIMTPQYKKDEETDREIKYMIKSKKPIFSVLVEGNVAKSIPTHLAIYQYVSTVQSNYREEIQKLVKYIHNHTK